MDEQVKTTGVIDQDNSDLLQMRPDSISVNVQSASESMTNSSHSFIQPQPLNYNPDTSQMMGDSNNSIFPKPINLSTSISGIESNNSRSESFITKEGNSLDTTAIKNILTLGELIDNEPIFFSNPENKKGKLIEEIKEKYKSGLVGIFIGAKGYEKKFIYAKKNLKFSYVIEKYKEEVKGPNIISSNFLYKNEYIDPDKTIEELKIKPLAQIYDYKK